MTNPNLTELVRKYLRGQATEAEKAQLERVWNQLSLDDSVLHALTETERQALRDRMLARIWAEIGEREDKVRPLHPTRTRAAFRWVSPLRWAAAVAVLLLAAMGVYRVAFTGPTTVRTAYGERREVTLPDGSTVVLNGNSSLRYARWNDTEARQVWLEGEAFFSVRHTRNHQEFTVNTPDQLRIEVLGTKFNVYNRRGATEVVLQEGKVNVVDAARRSVVLRPGQGVRHAPAAPRLAPAPADVSRELAWKSDLLLFEDQPLADICADLRDSHGLEVEFRNPALARERFSGSVPAADVTQLFRKIEKIYGVRVTREGERYVVE